ncbi:MAG: response regulator [Eubacterium sp.]|nr:response regulator [Eubacterium sp.]
MKAICVDDEKLILDENVSLVEEIEEFDSVEGFTSATKALEYVKKNGTDIALLDIDMPDMNGLMLAAKIKEASPRTAIIFLTGYSEYALKAIEMHASGYLMKPVNKTKLKDEIAYALNSVKKEAPGEEKNGEHIFMRTFGSFDVFVDGNPVHFSRAKSKELLAFLVDRQGASVTRAEAFAAMYEDESYTRDKQKLFDVIVRGLKSSLKEAGIEEIFDMQRGTMRVVKENFDCDLYKFLEGDTATINMYIGEYMSSYEWAMFTEGALSMSMY